MNIIDEIFYGNISGANCKTTNEYKKSCAKELKLYEKIKQKLNKEDMELVEELLKLYGDSASIAEKNFYKYGFKVGLLIGIECSKLEDIE